MKAKPTFKLRVYEHDVLCNMGLLETFCFVNPGIRIKGNINKGRDTFLFRNTKGIYFLNMENL